jgi:predicted component of type VI protein secretion system
LHFGFESVAPKLKAFEHNYPTSMVKRKSALKAMLDLREQILNLPWEHSNAEYLREFLSNERIANSTERLLADNLL